MHRSLLRTKLAASRTKVATKVTERATSMVPIQGDAHTCLVCKRKMRFSRNGSGEGRVCSPRCAKAWSD
ncbi:hypothetical protein DFQ14_108111 [Halopolyspora algeriensis]|uniref:Uncharacterized protein n=1 Tax=Halopolyspora algeriensis TaxID=1500506 RepID=A0A368VTS7_9ACTN|nr:hypothetical protein [Halopolyspora algeriensis]RCW42853.1 hypothetical protein DFQ14_108111 [Halopolyspora algeriensis]TQM56677.1 hypothetical protein FHU43_1489 [Halopolyspora algeriensis]